MSRLRVGRACDFCGELYFPWHKVPEGRRGYCSSQHAGKGGTAHALRAVRRRASELADLFGPITPEEMARWKGLEDLELDQVDEDQDEGGPSWLDV